MPKSLIPFLTAFALVLLFAGCDSKDKPAPRPVPDVPPPDVEHSPMPLPPAPERPIGKPPIAEEVER